jgi:hypothetical protein
VATGLEERLAKKLSYKKAIHHSFPLTAFTALRDIFHELDEFLLLDVSGEVTDLSLVKNNVLLETMSFPKGSNFGTRRLAEDLNVSMDEANSSLRMFVENTLDRDVMFRIKRSIEDIQYEWANDFKDVFKNIKGKVQTPTRLFYISNGYFLPILDGGLVMAGVKEVLTPQRIGYKMLHDHIEFVDRQRYDPFLGIATYFLNKTL